MKATSYELVGFFFFFLTMSNWYGPNDKKQTLEYDVAVHLVLKNSEKNEKLILRGAS